MQQSLVASHFKQKLDVLVLESEQKNKLVQKTQEISQNIYNQLSSKELTILGHPRTLSPLIKKIQKKEIANQYIQEQILIKRKKEAEKLKIELNDKLSAVNTSINFISTVEQPKGTKNYMVYDERVQRYMEVREKFMKPQNQEEAQKVQKQLEEQTKQWHKEQKQREKIKKQLLKENQRRLEEQIKQAEEQKKQQQQIEKEAKLLKLKQQHEELIKRKQEREEFKKKGAEHKKTFGQKTPLFRELHQRYEKEVLMPELEKRKEELKKRRQLVSSINQEEIKKHSEKYDMTNQELREKRKRERKEYELEIKTSQSLYTSNILKTIIDQEKQSIQEQEQKQKKKFELIQKRNKYAELIKSTQLPTPSEKKQEELQRLKSALTTQPRQTKLKEIKDEANKQKWHSKTNQMIKGQDGKWRELNSREKRRIQSLTPKVKPISQPQLPIPNSAKYCNYLADLKKEKQSIDLSQKLNQNQSMKAFEEVLYNPQLDNLQKFEKVKKKVDQLEYAAKQQELRMNPLSEANKKCLRQNEKVSSMYIDTIKAKIALLEEIQT